jgi:hypothetical protein
LVYEQNTTVIQYELRGAAVPCRLELRPLIAFRDYHSTTHENGALNPQIENEAGNLKITPYPGLPSLYLTHAGEARATRVWYRDFELTASGREGSTIARICSTLVFSLQTSGATGHRR